MITRAIPVLFMLTLVFPPAVARAQDSPARPASGAAAQNGAARAHDPLWNGIVLGGSLGALLGAFVGVATVDCQECAGFSVTAAFAAIGAGAGMGLGAGVDAMRGNLTMPAGRRVQLSPMLAGGRRGIVGRIRF